MRIFIVIALLSAIGFQVPAAFASTTAERAEELFLEGKYDKAMMEADKAINADSGKRYELYYLKGLSALKLNKFAEARKAFEYVKDRYPRSDRALDSYIGIGDAYFLEGNSSEALRAYKTAADVFADDKNIVVIRQRITECLAKPGAQESPKEYAAVRSVDVKPAEVRSTEKLKKTMNFAPKKKVSGSAKSPAQEAVSRDNAGKFSVQVGSFKDRFNALKLVSKLSARHYDARLESPAVSSDKLYRVKVGKFSSEEDVNKLAVKLKREGYPTKVCRED